MEVATKLLTLASLLIPVQAQSCNWTQTITLEAPVLTLYQPPPTPFRQLVFSNLLVSAAAAAQGIPPPSGINVLQAIDPFSARIDVDPTSESTVQLNDFYFGCVSQDRNIGMKLEPCTITVTAQPADAQSVIQSASFDYAVDYTAVNGTDMNHAILPNDFSGVSLYFRITQAIGTSTFYMDDLNVTKICSE